MTHPVIILGAGASHDYIDSRDQVKNSQYRPPLTKDLFNTKNFEAIITEFREVGKLTGDILYAVRGGQDLESFLLTIREKALAGKSHRQQQLVALMFYLHKLFQKVTDNYGDQSANNYHRLINQIQDNSGDATIITFNYDSLLEQSIVNLSQLSDLQSYLKGPIKVIKLHGSCDWVFYFEATWPEHIKDAGGIYKFLLQNYKTLDERSKQEQEIHIKREYEQSSGGRPRYYYPAIAIPLPNKHAFVCPDDHVKVMKKSLSQANKILIIGWKAGDENLIKIFEEIISHPVEVTIVSKGTQDAKEVENKLKHIVHFTFKTTRHGFTAFMGSSGCNRFFGE